MEDAELAVLEVLEDLTNQGLEAMLAKYNRPPLPSRLLKELFSSHPGTLTYQFISSYAHTPGSLLEDLAEITDEPSILLNLARHPRASRQMLIRLAEHPSLEIRCAVAENKSITPQIADVLAGDPHMVVRAILAENPILFARVQGVLADDPEPLVRAALTRQKNLSREALAKLSKDDNVFIKTSLIVLSQAQLDKQLAWADSDDLGVQKLLLKRKMLHPEVLESLCFSPHPEISCYAISQRNLKPDELLGWAESESEHVRKLIASKDDLPPSIQAILANDSSQDVRRTLAMNRNLAPEVLDLLFADETTNTALAANAALDEDMITRFCQYELPTAHKVLAARRDLSGDHLHELVNERRDFGVIFHLAFTGYVFLDTSAEMTHNLAFHELPTLRAFAASSHRLSKNEIPRLCKDPCKLVRLRLAHNTSIGKRVLTFLTSDPCPEVALVAEERLAAKELPKRDILLSDDWEEIPQEASQSGFFEHLINEFIKF